MNDWNLEALLDANFKRVCYSMQPGIQYRLTLESIERLNKLRAERGWSSLSQTAYMFSRDGNTLRCAGYEFDIEGGYFAFADVAFAFAFTFAAFSLETTSGEPLVLSTDPLLMEDIFHSLAPFVRANGMGLAADELESYRRS